MQQMPIDGFKKRMVLQGQYTGGVGGVGGCGCDVCFAFLGIDVTGRQRSTVFGFLFATPSTDLERWGEWEEKKMGRWDDRKMGSYIQIGRSEE